MKGINYKSDFKLVEKGCDFGVPFVFEYRTGIGKCYKASHVDGEYTHCKLMEDGRLMVIFDDHGLHPGVLTCERHFSLTDQDFHDNICDLWDKRPTGIILTPFQTDDCEAEVQLPPYYQQGEPMRWDNMSEEDKEALNAAVVQKLEGQLVQVVPVDETEYEDYFNSIKIENE